MYIEEPLLGMQYNTQRGEMRIPEYGRNVQKMVQYCLTIEDREHRNKVAHSIIDVIGNLNPHIRDVPDFKHKLWDHLFIMSNFNLDVDSPYPIPTAEHFESKPELLEYPEKSRRYRYYGKVSINLLKDLAKTEDNDYRKAMVIEVANQMKKAYLTWNKNTVDNDVILNDIQTISEGKISTEGIELRHISAPKKPVHKPQKGKNNHHRKKYKK